MSQDLTLAQIAQRVSEAATELTSPYPDLSQVREDLVDASNDIAVLQRDRPSRLTWLENELGIG